MRSGILAVASFVGGLILLVGICTVFEYISVQSALSFALKNGIYQASKVAMVPEIVCELVENPEYDSMNSGDEIPEFIEICEEIYQTEAEYFHLLQESILSYIKSPFLLSVELMAYEAKPFLARARLSGKLDSVFWDTTITVDEMVIAH